MNSSFAPLGPRKRNSLMINCPGVAVAPKNGVQANVLGVTINDQLFNVPAIPASSSAASICQVPWVLAPFILLSSPIGSGGPNPKTAQEGELATGSQLPVYGARALVASSISPTAWLSINILV